MKALVLSEGRKPSQGCSRNPRSNDRAPPRRTIVAPQSKRKTLRGMMTLGSRSRSRRAIAKRPAVAASTKATRS